MHSVSRSIEAVALVAALWCLSLGSLLYAPRAAADGSIPGTCSMVDGVYVCGDGSDGSSGSVCVTTVATGNQTCINPDTGMSGGVGGKLARGLGSIVHMPPQTTGTGWLSRLTGWIAYAINAVFSALVQILKDLVTYLLAAVLSLVQMAIAAIPVPSWLANNSMGTILGSAGPITGFFMTQLQIPGALALIGAGYAFRLLRKFLTLFQW